jgi:hypothetical protein
MNNEDRTMNRVLSEKDMNHESRRRKTVLETGGVESFALDELTVDGKAGRMAGRANSWILGADVMTGVQHVNQYSPISCAVNLY